MSVWSVPAMFAYDQGTTILKRVAITTLFTLTAMTSPVHAEGLPFTDKAAHFGVSYVLTDQLVRVGVAPDVALMGVVGLGLAKELIDAQQGVFDFGDLSADIAGALCAGYLRLAVQP